MSVHSGVHGTVNGISALRNWQVTEGWSNVRSASSATKHGTNRNRGVFDWTGQLSAYGAVPPAMPGEYINFVGYKAPNAAGNVLLGEIMTGQALVSSVAITWNFTTNELLSYVMQFGGNGDLTKSTGAPFNDTPPGTELTPCAGKITHLTTAGATETRIEHVTQAVLTFTREMRTSVNSGNSSGAGSCLTSRRPGSSIDWTLAITTEDANEVADLASGLSREFRCYTNATEYWQLKWGILGPRSALNVDRETGNIVGMTHNASMRGVFGTALGAIRLPGASSDWWPAA